MHEQRIRRKVEYADTDMSGIVHFARFLVFMENAEHAFLKAVGPGVQWRDGEGREITGCATQGESFEDLLHNLYEAVEACLAVDLEPAEETGRDRVIEIAV